MNLTFVYDLWMMLSTKIICWLNLVTWNINPLQISSQSDENWGFKKSHVSCWPCAYVDLSVKVDLKNNSLVQFSELNYISSWNFKSIRWKLRSSEISPLLMTFGWCWPKNNWLVEFSDLKYKSTSNLKSIGWKLTILEIRPMLTFSPMWTPK